MRILRVNDDHYVVDSSAQASRYACLLLNRHLNHGDLPDKMVPLARQVCAAEDGGTALQLLSQVDDVAVIPVKVL